MYEKFILNTQIKPNLPKTGKITYPPIILAFEYWDIIQDTYGAPGFNCNPLRMELTEEMDKDIAITIFIMEKTINQMHNKRETMSELLAYKDPRNILYSYKWRMICRNNRKRSYLTNTTDKRNNTENRNEEVEEHMSNINGCGDTTWNSDIE
ncbi:hypothetical protein ILUMI_23128 [Ignelater luminosus]|uniref:Uncharacterized protein n=1 Tax=Ignelater luminosus TaxID=2038154 RepID=A0A8K0G1Y2_IGNLU|nr:hypothetical protein ILUMI_23128 [Ignelater luminosus]